MSKYVMILIAYYLSCTSYVYADIYRLVDSNGVVHFTSTPQYSGNKLAGEKQVSAADVDTDNWLLYFENKLNMKFYIAVNDVQLTPEGNILIWERLEGKSAKNEDVVQKILYEVDCSRMRYKTIDWYVNNVRASVLISDRWEYYGIDDLNKTRRSLICSIADSIRNKK